MNDTVNNDFIMSPKVDFAFKEIMNNEKVRKGFLSAVLEIPVESIKSTVLKNTNLPRIHEDEKQSILDVYLTLNNNTEIDIEIQLAYMKSWAERSTFYLSKMVSEQKNINLSYSNLKKCVAINLLDFNYIKQTERFHTVYHINEDSENIRYTNIMEWHIVELPKLPVNDDGTDLYDWIKFLVAKNKEEFEMAAQTSEYINEAYQTLEVISQDEKKRLAYLARQKYIADTNTLLEENLERGIEIGKAEGAERTKIITVSNALAKGIAFEVALQIADLTEESYNALKDKYSN